MLNIPVTRTSLPNRVVCGEIDPAIEIALNRNPQPWFDDIICHGHRCGLLAPIINGAHVLITAQELARFIRRNTTFGTRPIRLLSCWAGRDPNGFAQQLADLLRVPVLAAADRVEVYHFEPVSPDERFRMFWPTPVDDD
ncbi:MAG: hypothetical protein DIU80_007640 [Chloroflexota bacterium]